VTKDEKYFIVNLEIKSKPKEQPLTIKRLEHFPPNLRQPMRRLFQRPSTINIINFIQSSSDIRTSRWEVFLCPHFAGELRVFYQPPARLKGISAYGKKIKTES
jgi:hypothetical protein